MIKYIQRKELNIRQLKRGRRSQKYCFDYSTPRQTLCDRGIINIQLTGSRLCSSAGLPYFSAGLIKESPIAAPFAWFAKRCKTSTLVSSTAAVIKQKDRYLPSTVALTKLLLSVAITPMIPVKMPCRASVIFWGSLQVFMKVAIASDSSSDPLICSCIRKLVSHPCYLNKIMRRMENATHLVRNAVTVQIFLGCGIESLFEVLKLLDQERDLSLAVIPTAVAESLVGW
jgi:hypothetical protein